MMLTPVIVQGLVCCAVECGGVYVCVVECDRFRVYGLCGVFDVVLEKRVIVVTGEM